MDEAAIRRIQAEGAAALLDEGVSVPLKQFRLPFRKKPVTIRITMRRPTMGGQINISRVYNSMGVTSGQMEKFTKEEEMKFIAEHGKDISRIIAYTFCRGWFARNCLVRIAAWWICNCMEWKFQKAAMQTFISLMGTKDFTPIIRSVERVNPMKLRLSHKRKGS